MARRRHHSQAPSKGLTALTANAYLAYLDKEMTIMGILSTFCVAVIALMVDRVGSAESSKYTLFRTVREYYHPLATVGSIWLLLSAGLFYMQRSHLAWICGQLSLSIETADITKGTAEDWLLEADAWRTWIRYQAAFVCLWLGFFGYGLAFFGAATHNTIPYQYLWIPPTVTWAIAIPYFVILWHSDSDTPVRDFFGVGKQSSRENINC
jgi:hypothetical protein